MFESLVIASSTNRKVLPMFTVLNLLITHTYIEFRVKKTQSMFYGMLLIQSLKEKTKSSFNQPLSVGHNSRQKLHSIHRLFVRRVIVLCHGFNKIIEKE